VIREQAGLACEDGARLGQAGRETRQAAAVAVKSRPDGSKVVSRYQHKHPSFPGRVCNMRSRDQTKVSPD
jgi:hypothetical protein